MRNWKPKIIYVLLLVFVALSLILAGCSLTGSGGDPYSAGQKARSEFDQASKQAGDFVAGFCSATPLPIAALGLVVVLRRAKKA
jgi:hypothetical protein